MATPVGGIPIGPPPLDSGAGSPVEAKLASAVGPALAALVCAGVTTGDDAAGYVHPGVFAAIVHALRTTIAATTKAVSRLSTEPLHGITDLRRGLGSFDLPTRAGPDTRRLVPFWHERGCRNAWPRPF